MVVSDMKERLSPKNEPPTTMATDVGQVDARLFRQSHGYGSQCDDSSYACSYREGDEAGGDEDAASSRLSGSICRVRFTVASMAPICFGALGECSCKDEYPYHQHDVLVTGATENW